jgi:hypothetical protein
MMDQDLKGLGVFLGHRRKLLRAIADLDAIAKSAPAVASTCDFVMRLIEVGFNGSSLRCLLQEQA